MATPMVKLAGVSRTYGSDAPVQALRNVDLEVRTGEQIGRAHV
jgi:ABC-type methionine transport system ATPase subunit